MINNRIIINPASGLTNVVAISDKASINSGVSLKMNGYLADKTLNQTPILEKSETTRNLRLQSFADISDISFEIVGKQNGRIVSESINGPTGFGNIVNTANYYDVVDSITPNASSLNLIDVGLGNKVYLHCPINLNKNNINYNFDIVTEGLGGSFSLASNLFVYNSLEDIRLIPLTYDEIIEKGYLHQVDSVESGFSQYMMPTELGSSVITNYLLKFTIADALVYDTEFVVFNFIQV